MEVDESEVPATSTPTPTSTAQTTGVTPGKKPHSILKQNMLVDVRALVDLMSDPHADLEVVHAKLRQTAVTLKKYEGELLELVTAEERAAIAAAANTTSKAPAKPTHPRQKRQNPNLSYCRNLALRQKKKETQ